MLKVNLTYKNQQEALDFARRMCEYKELVKQSSLQTKWQVEAGGEMAEASFRQAFDIPFTKQVHDGGDPGWDYTLERCKIEIKSISSESYNFVLSQDKVSNFKADIGVLVKPNFGGPLNSYIIYGYITKEEIVEKAEIFTFRNGNKKLMVKKEDMTKIESKEHFLEVCREYARTKTISCC